MRSTSLAAVLVLLGGCSLYLGDDAPPPPDPPPAPLPRCAPGPVTRASTVAPELRAWILDAEASGCSLSRRDSTGVANGFPTPLDVFAAPGTVTCDGDGCWTSLPAVARAWSAHPSPAAFTYRNEPLGEQWVGMAVAERNQTTGDLRATLTAMEFGSSALRRFERRWDAAGHLLIEREWFSGQLWFTVINTWEGDHLVASRYVDTVNGTGETDATWTYDGEHLATANARHLASGAESRARLRVDDAGRLIEIVRTLGAVPWMEQRWSYAGDVVSRATTVVSPQVDAMAGAALAGGADDLQPVIFAGAQGEWDLADGLVARADGCAALPHALQYGYPEADGGYALGWAVGDRPDGIDTDYGFGNVYDVGMDRWFGHDRVEAYVFIQPWSDATVTGDQIFDEHGRMVVEHVHTSDGAIDAVRSRGFAGANLAWDQRVLQRDGERLTSLLAFEHDDTGRLITRTYLLDGQVAGRHRWWREGDTAAHQIESPALPLSEPGRSLTIPDVGPLATLSPPVLHTRTASGPEAGADERWSRDGVLLSTRRHDASGRLIWRSLWEDDFESFAYAADGALDHYVNGSGPASPPYLELAYQRAATGRLEERVWSYGTAGQGVDRFVYTCR